MRALLTRHLPSASVAPLILLNANASDMLPLRRWESARYAELAGRLLARFPEACIAFTGAGNEAEKSQRLARQVDSPRCFSLAGETTLRQLLVLYGLASVLVTNDSGPAHFATLTPIHTVTLFGPETPAPLFGADPAQHPALGRAGVQPLRQRAQPPPVRLPGQRLYAPPGRRTGVRRRVRELPRASREP